MICYVSAQIYDALKCIKACEKNPREDYAFVEIDEVCNCFGN